MHGMSWISVPISFATAMLLIPITIKKLKERGITAPDRYKIDRRDVPTCGGTAIITASAIALIVTALLCDLLFDCRINKYDIAHLLVMIFFGFFGLIDDFYDIGRTTKIFLPVFLTFPVLSVLDSSSNSSVVLPFLGVLDLGMLIYPVSAVYVMVVSNLVNMHSGFNGLASGLSVMLLATLFVKTVMRGQECLFLGCVLGATIAFWWFNRYPARIFLGNVGSLSLGAVTGAVIVANGFFLSGFIMLIPHTVNFLMYVFWRVMHKINPDASKWRLTKFGYVLEDGTLYVPNALTLKWVLPYHFRMTEVRAVLAMYALSAPFCIASLFVPF